MIIGLARLPRWRRILLLRTPAVLFEYPFELFLALLCLLSGVPLLLGTATPRSVDALLPEAVVKMWALMLVLGAGATCYGLLARLRAAVVGGLRMLGDAALVYSIAIFAVVGTRGLLAGGITLAFAVACLARAFHLSTTAMLGDPMAGDDDA